ncbi:MAG: MAPEG family protein [Woeseiaceae bacterium]|nr:MAPEG family protein [Woeseiaceae bacterium]
MDLPSILAPAAVLVLWSLVVLLWVTATRFPAFAKAGIDVGNSPRGARYADIEKDMPPQVNWVSHNYTHLMEQPTIFYAAVAILAIAGNTAEINLYAAWGYAGLRIVHSLWQGLVNVVKIRILLFTLSTICLWVLAINGVRVTVF